MSNSFGPQGLPSKLSAVIIEMATNGMSRPEIVRQLNEQDPSLALTYSQVYHLTRHLPGVITRDIMRERAFYGDPPRLRRDVVMELYDAGMKPMQISEKLGIHYKHVVGDISYAKQKRAMEQASQRQTEHLKESPVFKKGPEY